MVQTVRLKQEILARGMTMEQVAWGMGISEKCLGRKLETGKFGSEEMQVLTELLHLQCPQEIFFAKR